MSVSYTAKAIIGIPVDSGIFYLPPKTVKAFEHDYPPTMKFDPQSGRKLWEEEEECRPEYDERHETFGGFPLVRAGDHDGTWLAVLLCEDADYGRKNKFRPLPADLEEQKAALRALLDPLGAWDEEKFGLHAIQYVSC